MIFSGDVDVLFGQGSARNDRKQDRRQSFVKGGSNAGVGARSACDF